MDLESTTIAEDKLRELEDTLRAKGLEFPLNCPFGHGRTMTLDHLYHHVLGSDTTQLDMEKVFLHPIFAAASCSQCGYSALFRLTSFDIPGPPPSRELA
jgi:hypothetical protein